MLLLVQAVPMDRSVQISGKKLAALRKRRYMTQAEFSAALGIGNSRVAQIEAVDDVGVYLKNFRKLATALGMTADQLLVEIGVGSADVVMVPLPRPAYDAFAAKASKYGYPDVPAYLIRLAEGTPMQHFKRDEPPTPGPPDGLRLQPPAPAETPAKPRKSGRQRQQAR
jgi:transcriptional regulator with XRE-family HTH domain